jgi:glycosyltransferase involved in cell wall biosynthesis
MTPAVSIILPFYNTEATLETAVLSIRDQSFPDWELIVFNDGSTDGGLYIAQGMAKQDPRIQVIDETHRGIVTSLQQASSMARGEFIARMDADDIAHPDRIAAQVNLLQDNPAMGLCGTQINMTGENIGSGRRRYERWINNQLSHEDMIRELFVECPIPHPTFMMRRSDLEHIDGYQERGWPEDYDLVMRMWRAGFKLGKVALPLLDWFHSNTRHSMTHPRYEEASFRALKRHYLLQTYLRAQRPFYQWGAGEVGKRWLREWETHRPQAVVDINPRKIGAVIHGVPVIPPEDLPQKGEAFILCMVGAPGARADIRSWFAQHGYEELRDYLFCA